MAATTAQNTSQHGQSQPSEQSEHKSAKPPIQLEQLSEPIDQDPNDITMQDAARKESYSLRQTKRNNKPRNPDPD